MAKKKKKQRTNTVKPVFVESIPVDLSDLKEGILLVCMKYSTLVHRCPCGCGGLSEIGLHPATRIMIYDGQNISVEPSIGVNALPCRSHYWIKNNRIVWARALRKGSDRWYEKKRRDLNAAFEKRSGLITRPDL